MAGKRISQLSGSISPKLTGYTVYDDGLTTYKTTLSSLKDTILSGSGGNYATKFSNNFNGNQVITGSLSVGIGSFTQGNPEILHVGNEGSFNIAHFEGNVDNYAQVNIQNFNPGNDASSDLVITADNGTEDLHYINIGVNSSTYNAGEVGYQNDAYVINKGNDLFIGTANGNPIMHSNVFIFTSNNWQRPQIKVHGGTPKVTFNRDGIDAGYVYQFSGSMKLDHNLDTIGTIRTNNIQNIDQDLNIKTYNTDNIGLWAEGGTINVTGSLLVGGTINSSGYDIDANGGNISGYNLTSNGTLSLGGTYERVIPYSNTNTINHSFVNSAIIYVTNLSSNLTLNITTVLTDNNRILGFTLMIEQGSSAYGINSLKINNQNVSISWHGGTPPNVNANSTDIISLSLIRINNTWRVLGQLTTF